LADILPIRVWADPVLSKVCDKIEDNEFGPKLEEFGLQLRATMEHKNGVGLAGPQVGVAKRIFVMEFPDHENLEPTVICNPVLDLSGGSVYAREGCLSLPNVFEQVCRAEQVSVRYQHPLDGKESIFLLDKFDARVAQHEFDHLNGIMFFDYKDKRPVYGARMSKQVGKQVLRAWDKEKVNHGESW
jgi:peptide deformylase